MDNPSPSLRVHDPSSKVHLIQVFNASSPIFPEWIRKAQKLIASPPSPATSQSTTATRIQKPAKHLIQKKKNT